jgi:hypothetical protein
MNLESTISIYSGGPGSGCTGPNCGRRPSQLLHGTTLTNAVKIAKRGFKPNEEGYVHFTPLHDIAESYGAMHDKAYAVVYFNVPKDMSLEKDPDPEELLGPGAVRYKGEFKPDDLSIEVYSKSGEPVDSWHSSLQSQKDLADIVRQARTLK